MFLELSEQGVFDDVWVEEVQKNLALKRWGATRRNWSRGCFLLNKAHYVTGQQISVAGGYGIAKKRRIMMATMTAIDDMYIAATPARALQPSPHIME